LLEIDVLLFFLPIPTQNKGYCFALSIHFAASAPGGLILQFHITHKHKGNKESLWTFRI